MTLSRITKSSKNKYQKNLFFSIYKTSCFLFHFVKSLGKKASWKVQGISSSVSSVCVLGTSNQRLHALSLVRFICYNNPTKFVYVGEAKSEVLTVDQAEHSFVKIVIMLLKQ